MLEHIGRVPRPSETMDAGSGAQLAPRPTARRLTVGSADDRAEHQADKIADRVIRAMAGIPQRPVALGPAELPSTDGCVRRRIDPGAVPRRPGPEGGELDEELSGRIRRTAGTGRPLPSSVRRAVGAAFGTDLDSVRVHAESRIAPMVGASAFTIGRDIHFAPGEYRPDGEAGRRLMGHEIGHVIQQSTATHAGPAHEPSAAHVLRALPSDKDYQTLDAAVADAVRKYNEIPVPILAGEFQHSFNKLQAVERAVHRWFDTFSTTHERFREDDAATSKFQSLLDKIDAEHELLISKSTDLESVLPFDASGLDNKELSAMQSLWQDIVKSRGKIRLVGSDDFNQRTMSHLGRILSTPTGRQMLSFLNSPSPSEGTAANPMTNTYIGEQVAQIPQDVRTASPDLEDRSRAEAQPLGIDESKPKKTVEAVTAVTSSKIGMSSPSKKDYPTVTGQNLGAARDAAWQGKKGFVAGKQKYKFNTGGGTGAFVTNVPSPSQHPGKVHKHQILSPTWVTLGHELGHAANFRSGSTTLKQNNLMGLTKDEEWDNPEELLNIENVENALRSESGLTERFGHRPPDYLLKLAPKVRVALRRPLDMLGKHDHVRYKVDGTSEYGKLYLRMNGLKADVATEPEEAAACADDVRAFVEAELTQPWITTNARKDAQDALDRIVPDLKAIFT